MTDAKVQMRIGQERRMGQSSSMHVVNDFKPGSDAYVGLHSAVVEEILLNLPAEKVVLNCRLVCHEWRELVDSAAHWRERCRREGFKLRDTSRQPDDWRLFYFLSKKRHNLLKNPGAEDDFNGWKLIQNGGDGWKIEENFAALPNDTNDKCFATSYGLCLKQQLIDLNKEGYNPAFMDCLQPDIKISDWYAPRWDCGSQYEICVELLDQKKRPISLFQPKSVCFQQWSDQQWCQISGPKIISLTVSLLGKLADKTIGISEYLEKISMTHVFRDYERGVRFIRFTHGGMDTQYWKGWYGIRVINSSVEICPAAET